MSPARLAILLLFFGSLAAVVLLYAAHRPQIGRWFILVFAASWWLRARFGGAGRGED